jgi:hypothetical protein
VHGEGDLTLRGPLLRGRNQGVKGGGGIQTGNFLIQLGFNPGVPISLGGQVPLIIPALPRRIIWRLA